MSEPASTAAAELPALVSQLTLEEKASLCLGSTFWHTRQIERLGIGRIMVADGPHGLRMQPGEGDHIGLSGSVPATCFPTAAGLASSWNVELIRSVGEALGREARRWNVSVLLGPGVNMKRSPLCGRNFEYFSEDPVLAGELAVAMVNGIQSQGVGTSVKHYAANNQEADRLRVSADVDERTLREIYLPAFERVVAKAQPWTVMCAYNKVNGRYASEHSWLLTEVLRDEWGFQGLVVSDWGAVHDRVAALAAGLDLEMPPNLGRSDVAIVDAVRDGRLDPAVLDLAAARVLALVERSQPALQTEDTFDAEAHHTLARAAAAESAVLLKNEDSILPLQPAPGSKIAVIGEFARTPRFQGAGSSQVNPTRLDVALEEIRAGVGADVTVDFAPGFGLDTTEGDEHKLAEALGCVDGADVVLLFLGLPGSAESEGFDRTHLDLPDNQLALFQSLAAVSDRIVVVLANGSTVGLSGWEQRAAAILECWLGGQAAGGAVADLLLGRANPSGKLAESIPLRLEDNSSFLNFPGDSGHVRYGEGIFIGYRGYDKLLQPVNYPFGFGLSYTRFVLGDLEVSQVGSVADGDLAVQVATTLTNVGPVAGAEVVQVYIGDRESSVARPVRELKAFAKAFLEPGETRRLGWTLEARDFSFWSELLHRWVVEAGEFEISVGFSSRDLPATTTIRVDAPTLAPPLHDMSTLEEWLADPRGRELLMSGAPEGMLADQELLRVIGTMPMRTLASFPGQPLTHQKLDELLSLVAASE